MRPGGLKVRVLERQFKGVFATLVMSGFSRFLSLTGTIHIGMRIYFAAKTTTI